MQGVKVLWQWFDKLQVLAVDKNADPKFNDPFQNGIMSYLFNGRKNEIPKQNLSVKTYHSEERDRVIKFCGWTKNCP